MRPNPQETAYLVIFTEEILNGKLHFLCSVIKTKKWQTYEVHQRLFLSTFLQVFLFLWAIFVMLVSVYIMLTLLVFLLLTFVFKNLQNLEPFWFAYCYIRIGFSVMKNGEKNGSQNR